MGIQAKLTELVDIILAFGNVCREVAHKNVLVFGNGSIALCQDIEFVPWDIVLLNRLANDLFGDAVRIHVGRVPLDRRYRLVLRCNGQ